MTQDPSPCILQSQSITMPASISLPPVELTPFKINVPAEEIDALKQKLALTTLPDELENAGRDYGVPLEDIERLLTRWKFGYDWKEHEKQLNEELPQFQTKIEVGGFGTLNVHFVHRQSTVDGAIPLLFVHGCESFASRGLVNCLTSVSQQGLGAFLKFERSCHY